MMNSPIDRRPQTGPLNPAMIASSPPVLAHAASAPMQEAAAAPAGPESPTDVVSPNLAPGKANKREALVSKQPVSVAFPDRGAGADAVSTSEDAAGLSRLNELLTGPQQQGPGDIGLLARFGLSYSGGKLVRSATGQALSADERQQLGQASRRRLTVLSNQGNTVNAAMIQKLGLSKPSMQEWIAKADTPEEQAQVLGMMIESNQKVMTSSVDNAQQYQGITGIMANAASTTAGFNDALIRMMRGEAVGELDLRQDANFTFAQILAETDPAKLNKLRAALEKASSPNGLATLGAADVRLLRGFGIYADPAKGQCINLVTGDALKSDQLRAIRQATGSQIDLVQGNGGVNGVALDAGSRSASTKIHAAITNLDGLQSIRNSLDQRAREIAGIRDQVIASNQALVADSTAIADLEHRIENKSRAQKETIDLSHALGKPDGETWLRAQAQSGHLGTINQSLAGTGLSLAVNKDRVTYSAQGKPVTRAVFQQALSQAIGRNATSLQGDQRALIELQDQRNTHLSENEKLTDNLEVATQAQEQDIQRYDTELARLETRTLPELRALKDDPASWNRLPAHMRQRIDELLARGQAELREAPSRRARYREQLSEAQSTIRASRDLMSKVRLASAATESFLARLKEDLAKLAPKVPDEAAGQVADKVEALIKEANRLCESLSLTAQPDSRAIAEQDIALAKSLSQLSALFRASQREQESRQQLQARFQQSYMQTSLDNLRYHLEKLQAFDKHGALQQAVTALQPQLRELGTASSPK